MSATDRSPADAPPSRVGPLGRLCDVLPSTLAALDVPGERDRLDLAARVGDVNRIAILLVDGLGYHLLPAAARHAPLLADVAAGRAGQLDELVSPLPSTTPASLASFATGTLPGENGILGFTLAVPGTDRVLSHLSWRDDPPPHEWQPLPTAFTRAAAAGVRSVAVLRPEFAGSGLTEAVYAGAEFVGAPHADELAECMIAALGSDARVVYGYHPTLDTMAHAYGIASEQWAGAARTVDTLLTRVVAGLPSDAALLVIADHGGLDVPAEGRIDLDADPRLSAGLRVVAGEARWRHLHTQPGAEADVLAAWREVLAGRALVRSRAEAIELGWFGPVPERHQARIGDVVVACLDETVVLASEHEPPESARLVAFHGSLTPVETAIPLITFVGGNPAG
jgi:hypothetical protein